MKLISRSAATIMLGLAVAACGTPTDAAQPTQPPIEMAEHGPDEVGRLTLSPLAAQRLGIETFAVSEEVLAGQSALVVPYAAVLYEADGSAWVYTNPEGLLFVRAEVHIDRVDGETAVLTAGPPVGTLVVTVGGAELWGAEHGVGGGH